MHKPGVVRKELNEWLVWLRMMEGRAMAPAETVGSLQVGYDERAGLFRRTEGQLNGIRGANGIRN